MCLDVVAPEILSVYCYLFPSFITLEHLVDEVLRACEESDGQTLLLMDSPFQLDDEGGGGRDRAVNKSVQQAEEPCQSMRHSPHLSARPPVLHDSKRAVR